MKHVSLLLLLSMALFSCQKELSFEQNTLPPVEVPTPPVGDTSGSTVYFIRFKMDGVARNFNVNNAATITDFADYKSLSLFGSASSSTTNFESLNLGIVFKNIAPATGEYTEENQGAGYLVSGLYNPNSMTMVYGAGIRPASQLPLRITITSMANGVITGTFQGAFYKQDLVNGGAAGSEYKKLTEGEFNLPLK